MKNKLNILFMGTPDFALGVLKRIYEQDHPISGVVTAPDKKAGRGKKTKESAVKQWAVSKQLPVYQPTNLKSDTFYDQLKLIDPDIIIVVAFRMLPRQVWDLPPKGTINLHASLLPDYRGAAPIHWAIINGEKKTGVTTFFIDEEIDTGKIILRKETGIDEDDNVGSLHDKLMHLGADLVIDTLALINKGDHITTDQKLSATDKKAPKLNKENSRINWQQDHVTLYNFIRGLSPFPCSWTMLNNNVSLKVYKARKTSHTSDREPGKISIKENKVLVATQDEDLEIEELQLQNRKRMTAKEAINGHLLKNNDVLC